MKLFSAIAALVFIALAPSIAHADPCTADLPRRAGETFEGTVRYVGDGDSLCVGPSEDPGGWIEVRLADFNAPERQSPEGARSKAILESVALGRQARCVAQRGRSGRVVSYDRVIAVCRIGGQRVGELLRRAGAPVGGN